MLVDTSKQQKRITSLLFCVQPSWTWQVTTNFLFEPDPHASACRILLSLLFCKKFMCIIPFVPIRISCSNIIGYLSRRSHNSTIQLRREALHTLLCLLDITFRS